MILQEIKPYNDLLNLVPSPSVWLKCYDRLIVEGLGTRLSLNRQEGSRN